MMYFLALLPFALGYLLNEADEKREEKSRGTGLNNYTDWTGK
jgi:hypothetical protein